VTEFIIEHPEATFALLSVLWTLLGGVVILLFSVGYRHIMRAFDRLETQYHVLGRRDVEILQRLTHIEAKVNGHPKYHRRQA
jgi:hypothetical protein